MKSTRWRVIFVSVLTLLALRAIAPTLFYFSQPIDIRIDPEKFEAMIPSWLPKKHVKLGLDLQGGVQLVLGVDTDSAIQTKLSTMSVEIQRWSDDKGFGVETAYAAKDAQYLTVILKEGADIDKYREAFKEDFFNLEQSDRDGNAIQYGYNEDQMKRIRQSALEQAERVVRTRVDKWGVSEPMINRRANGSILVQLPGFKDPERAKELLGRTAQLSFKIVDDQFKGFDSLRNKAPEGIEQSNNGGQLAFVGEDRQEITEFLKDNIPEDRQLVFAREPIGNGNKYRWTSYVVLAATELTGDDVMDASVGQGGGLSRDYQVVLNFTGRGGKRFADVTGANVNKRMAIILDDVVESDPVIQQKISGGTASITLGGGRTFQEQMEEANELALILKSGSVPAEITVMEERQVGASLGPELADQGIKGILVGLALVFVYMLVYYRRPGILSCLALFLNAVFLLAMMAGFGFALTLPGIAGFILTLGMAVDANVLINERIKHELKTQRNAKKALDQAFQKVFWTIVDANVTTLIAALVLLETNSSGPIKGFAITLMIGLIVSMFTSLYVTRLLFDVATSALNSDSSIRKWLGYREDRPINKDNLFNFLSWGKIATSIAAVIALGVMGVSATKGLNWGVDFAGGTELVIGFEKDVDSDDIVDIGKKVGLTNLTVQALGGGQKQFMLRYETDTGAKEKSAAASTEDFAEFKKALYDNFSAQTPEILQVDFVGPQVGRELQTQGILSVLYAIIGVLLYIALRFDMRFGPGAVIKMTLDVFVVLAFYAFFRITFDLTSVAAFLTVVGYSVNDTIVIYDRIRENLAESARRGLKDNINISLNETLSRTINTSVTTVAALVGILIFGSGQIWNFAMAMTIGVIVATLSSQFIASSFVLWLANYQKGKKVTA